MGVLSHLNPNRVFYYFEEISNIPRGSYNTKAVSDYCVAVAEGLGLTVRQDAWNNVVIQRLRAGTDSDAAGTSGYGL